MTGQYGRQVLRRFGLLLQPHADADGRTPRRSRRPSSPWLRRNHGAGGPLPVGQGGPQYDHWQHRVPRPTIVRDQRGVNDPHDNPSLTIDEAGHVGLPRWPRAASSGQIFRSKEPYSVESFDEIISASKPTARSGTFPGQVPPAGPCTRTAGNCTGRPAATGGAGTERPAETLPKLAGFAGHYYRSAEWTGDKIGTAFNYHPGGSGRSPHVNIYYAQTTDFGKSWTTVDGRPLTTPLDNPQNCALVVDYEARGRLFYITSQAVRRSQPPGDARRLQRRLRRRPEAGPARVGDHPLDRRALRRFPSPPPITTKMMGSLYLDGRPLDGDRAYAARPAARLHRRRSRSLGLDGPGRELNPSVASPATAPEPYVRRPHNPTDLSSLSGPTAMPAACPPRVSTSPTPPGTARTCSPTRSDGDWAEPILLAPTLPARSRPLSLAT